MNDELIKELIDASVCFVSGDVVDETDGTLPLMEKLKETIIKAQKIIGDEESIKDKLSKISFRESL
jgi:hypothetical protein